MKLNQGKKFYEKQKRIEEDKKFLNENNFFDRFGKSSYHDSALAKNFKIY